MKCSGQGKIKLVVISLCFLFVFEISNAQSPSFTSSNLPILVINTSGQTIVDEPKITASMGIIDNGEGVRNHVTDPFNNYEGKIGIEIRGSSSQSFPKKQYGIELRDAAGVGMSVPLLGMPAEEDWVLFAPYNDKSLMRDVLAYKLGRDLGWYAPRTRFCEVVLNGQYQGIYVLIEKIKRDKNRVDINKLNADEISGDNLTGGYIIKIDKESGSGNGGWTSEFTPPNRSGAQTIFFQYDYPKAADIVSQQKTYIKDFMANFEGALISTTFDDPVQGYTRYIDVNSFIDFFIANEISKNVDGYRLSTYLYKPKDSDGGKLHMGPIWDFNLGFGNANYCTQGNPEGWVTNFNTICPQDFWLIPFWWNRLNQDGAYRNKMAARWAELRSDRFQTSKIISYIDSVYTVLNAEAQQRNFQRWPVLSTYVWPNYYVGSSFQDEVNWLKTWVTSRLNWMDDNMPQLITGTDKSLSDFTLSAFPNPFEKRFTFEYTLTNPGRFTVELFDVMGKPIMKADENRIHPGTYQVNIRTEEFSAGVYYFRASIGNSTSVTGKVVKI
ncbi:MAG: CotH kinase family protein [Cyclobacteriaceae bacterium]|nr:CotH kinase family protein [Cyclobacteriaceae bacterium]